MSAGIKLWVRVLHLTHPIVRAGRAVITPIGLGVLLYLFASGGFMADLALADATIFLGLAISQAAGLLVAMRLGVVLRCFGIRLRPMDQWRIHLQSIFYYFFLPFGFGADVARFAKIAGQWPDASRWSIAAGVLVDRALGLATFLVLAAATAFFVLPAGTLSIDLPPWLLVSVPAVLAIPIAAAIFHWRHRVDLRRLGRAIRDRRGAIAVALILSFAMQALMAAAVYTAAQALSIDIGPMAVLFAVAAGAVMQAVPVTVAGAGMGEVAAASLYAAMGLSWREAVLLAAIDYGYRLLMAIMGGVWELFRIVPSCGSGAVANAARQPRTAAAKRNRQ